MQIPNPKFITLAEAVAIHDDLISDFGGSFGLRDEGLLESALAQPQASFFGELLHPTISDQAAAYLYHIARNHPFIDGNKRTALGVMEAFLILNGYELDFTEQEIYDLVLAVAQGQMEKIELSELLQLHLKSPGGW